VGLLLSRAGFNRYVRRATPLLILAANAPDVDVISYFFGRGAESYFEYHRGITHAIVATPLVALLPVLILRLVFRKEPAQWFRAWLTAVVGVTSHWLLDFTNAYGIRLLLPFSDAWPALDISAVIDIWIWAALLLATLWPMLARLVSSEIGASAKAPLGRGLAIFALSFVLCYDTARYFLKERVLTVQEARLYNGETPRRVLAFPTPFNPLFWRGVVETDRLWVVQQVNLASDLDPTAGQVFYKPESSPAIEAARRSSAFRTLDAFSRSLLWRVGPSDDIEGGSRVEAIDLRFGFRAEASIDAGGAVRESSFHFR
jgi:inner membrane protein